MYTKQKILHFIWNYNQIKCVSECTKGNMWLWHFAVLVAAWFWFTERDSTGFYILLYFITEFKKK